MSALIGRERELHTFETALDAARGGIGCCILLTGEAGIGKSRLIEELRHWAISEKFTILEGDCFEQEASFPYAPWIDALRAFFGSLNAVDIEGLLGPLAPEFVKLLPELASLIPQYSLHGLLNLKQKNIVYSNHSHGSALNRERLVQKIRLKSLNREEVEQMARTSLKTGHQIPASFVDAVMAFTDGNPFFVEEILKDLLEEGHIDQLLRQKSLDELHVPPQTVIRQSR